MSRLDRVDAQLSKLNDQLIAAGRGEEKYGDVRTKTDPLSQRIAQLPTSVVNG